MCFVVIHIFMLIVVIVTILDGITVIIVTGWRGVAAGHASLRRNRSSPAGLRLEPGARWGRNDRRLGISLDRAPLFHREQAREAPDTPWQFKTKMDFLGTREYLVSTREY